VRNRILPWESGVVPYGLTNKIEKFLQIFSIMLFAPIDLKEHI
jgi:hypothetical protein